MPPSRYRIVVKCDPASTKALDLVFGDDVQALVAARRLFVTELASTGQRPLSFAVGRYDADGRVHWLTRWTAPVAARPRSPRPAAAKPKACTA